MYQASEKVLAKPSVEAWEGAASRQRLGELLVARNDVQPADIEKTLQIQKSVGGKLGALLVRTGAISEDLLLQRLAEQQRAVYLRNAEDLPDSLDVYQFVSESPIKLEWFPRQRGAEVESGPGALLHRPRHPGPCTARNPSITSIRAGS